MRLLHLLVVTAALLSNACKDDGPPPEPPAVSALGTFTREDVRARAGQKMDALGMSATDKAKLREKLDRLFENEGFVENERTYGVQAVGAFSSGEGGLVVKYSKGTGWVDIAGGRSGAALEFESYSVGAQVGGSAMDGIVVFVGAPDTRALSGTYEGVVTQAAAVTEATPSVITLRHETHGHFAYIVETGKGLSADAGGARIRFTVDG